MTLPGGERALLVQAVEAAFALGPPAVGDQIVFSRIRIRFDAPVAGTYTVTYPYGVETFSNIAAGDLIFYTSDVGIGAAGDFSGALDGAIGPYLTPVDTNGIDIPPVVIEGDSFLTDGTGETLVTGSPFNTNYFEICVDGGGFDGAGAVPCVRSDEFVVFGKLHAAPIDSPLEVARATYATHMGMTEAHVDVFASAEAGPGELTPDLTVGVVGAPSARMIGPRDPGGLYYAQSVVPVVAIPNSVTVINSADTPPSSVQRALVDAISITQASYDATAGVLAITAMSSDMLSPPALSAIGIPGSVTGTDVLSPLDGTLSVTLPAGTVPPQTVTVVSSAGGSSTVTVNMPEHGTAFPVGAPLAVDDFISTGEDAPAFAYNIMANDGLEAVASTLTLLAGSGPSQGIAVNNFDGNVSYTPNAGYFGTDSFQYTVSSIAGLSSNIATVTIDVQQINDAPIANDDIAAAPGATPTVDVNVVANDTDLDGIAPAPGGLDPATVVVLTVTGASAIPNADGTVTYAKDAACELANNCSFTYEVSDLGGLTSNIANVAVSTAGNLAPIANADAASVLVEQSVTINVAANDVDVDGTVDPTSINVSTLPSDGSALANTDGTITFGAGPNAGTVTFGYTIADNLGAVSSEAIVTVTVNPNPDILRVLRAECRAGKNEWRVDGTSSVLTPHSVTVYAATTVGGGPVLGTYSVDNLGDWRVSKNNTNSGCAPFISIESSLGGKLEAVPVGN